MDIDIVSDNLGIPDEACPSAPSTPTFSTSESLASGLVSRLIREWSENEQRYWAAKRKPPGGRGLSKLPAKRAVGYRILRERSLGLIAPGHQLMTAMHGDQSGLDKRAGFGVVHWDVVPNSRRLQVLLTYGRPGWKLPLRWSLFLISDHALQRLYYRLKILKDVEILVELTAATHVICTWYPVLIARLDESMSVGVPTPRGMLILKRVPTTAPFSPCEYVGTTWVNDELIRNRRGQADALALARATNGLVLQVGDEYFELGQCISSGRLMSPTPPYSNVFYSEMLRHLPLATHRVL
jgi:hypothetical protein